jgi:hypothetical protein
MRENCNDGQMPESYINRQMREPQKMNQTHPAKLIE